MNGSTHNHMPVPDVWNVRGNAFENDGATPFTQGLIYVYCLHNGNEHQIAQTGLDHNGFFTLTFSKEQFQFGDVAKSTLDAKFKIRDYSGNLLWEYGVITIDDPEYEINPLLGGTIVSDGSANPTNPINPVDPVDPNNPADPNIPTDAGYCVFGTVTNNIGLPVVDNEVQAYALHISDNDKFSEVFLGKTNTDDFGNYTVEYDPDLLAFPITEDPVSHGAGTVSLFVKLPLRPANIDGQDNNQCNGQHVGYDTSPIVCHSARRQRIDIQVNRFSDSDISEYAQVRSALLAYHTALGDGRLDFREVDFANRVRYIFCKTGVDEEKIVCFYYSLHFFGRAAKEFEKTGSPFVLGNDADHEQFMYATFRAGYPKDIRSLCAVGASDYYAALTDALKNKIISDSMSLKLATFWTQWLETVQILTAAAETNNASASNGILTAAFAVTILDAARGSKPTDIQETELNEWLVQKAKDDETVRNLVRIYQNVQGDMEFFWNEMRNNADGDASSGKLFTNSFVAHLAFINDLYSISDDFAAFAQGAYKYLRTTRPSLVSAFDIRELAAVNWDDWQNMTKSFLDYTNGEYPRHLVGATNDEKILILAITTLKRYKEKYPAVAAAAVYAEVEGAKYYDISQFLMSDAAREFDLDKTNIDTFPGIPDTVDKDALKALQRINRLTENAKSQIYLIDEQGLDSSYKISSVDEDEFVAQHAANLGGVEEARQIHRLAVTYTAEALGMLAQFHNSLNFENASLTAVNRGLSSFTAASADTPSRCLCTPLTAKEPIPTYETLFGALTQVSFRNTQSVFGASAYFADLLTYIDGVSRHNLLSRRPELKEIELTDNNAETVLPYIDIVLEILENAVSPREFFMPDNGEAVADFLSNRSNPNSEITSVIPAELKNKLEEYAIEIPDEFEIVPQSVNTNNNGYYLLAGSWRVCFSARKNIPNADAGYLVTAYPQTSKSAAELAIMPEHRNPQAYKVMSKHYFPLQLPLNPGSEEARETMKLLGVSKTDAILALKRDRENRYDDETKLICANLGIDEDTIKLLEWNAAYHDRPWELWGLQSNGNNDPRPGRTAAADWTIVMSYVPEFLRRTGFDVEEMQEVFTLKTLNADNHIVLDSCNNGWKTGDPKLFEIQNLTADDLIKIHRLIRLRSILQCEWKELDSFLCDAYCDNGGMPGKLNKLHASMLFMARHPSVKLNAVGSFWRHDDSATDNSRVALLTAALKINTDDFYALKELTGIDPFDAAKPEQLLYFDDECARLSERGFKASDVKMFLSGRRSVGEFLDFFGMTEDFFNALADNAPNNEWWDFLRPEDLTLDLKDGINRFVKFTRLLDIQNVYEKFPIDENRLSAEDDGDIFWSMIAKLESCKNTDNNTGAVEALECLADIQGRWDRARFIDAVNLSEPKLDLKNLPPAALANPQTLSYILKSMPVLEKIGVSVGCLRNVLEADVKDIDVVNFRKALLRNLGVSSWNDMAVSVMNALRVRRRDALAAYLTHRDGYRDDNELYAHFLIDVKMNTEMTTSRIVQASAAVQLFMQRALMGLEPKSYLDKNNIDRWSWIKNYRVWEANRKVLLYPENWIDPELRDDKTPFFEEFEAELDGGEITSDIARNALGNYLSKLRDVAGVDIIGVYRGESEIPNGKDTLHVIGKTKSLPYQYYYRRCHRKGNLADIWTPWEPIGIDIEGNSVLPVMLNGHLHLFWARFKQANDPGEPQSFSQRDADGQKINLPIPQNVIVVEHSLSWSAFVDGKWSAKKETPSFVDKSNLFYTNQDPEANVADRYHFRVLEERSSSECVTIELCRTYEIVTYTPVYETNVVDSASQQVMWMRYFAPKTSLRKLLDIRVDRVKKIGVVGVYVIWHDGKVNFTKADNNDEREFQIDPRNTILTENYNSSFVPQAVVRSNGIRLLNTTRGAYKFLSANSGILRSEPNNEPGFLMEDAKTWFLQTQGNIGAVANYKIDAMSHPVVKEFQKRFKNGGLSNLTRRETQALSTVRGPGYGYYSYGYNYYNNILLGYYIAGDWQAWDAGQNAFEFGYQPDRTALSRPYPMDVVDFNYGTPNGIYNWELFFHAPFLVAKRLFDSHRYAEALDWYHLIFDPRNKLTAYEKTKRWALRLPVGARFWNFLPFFANADAAKTIETLMGLSDNRASMPDRAALKTLIDDWKNNPFNPHLIARSRIVAYQKAVVMGYLDTLTAWADQLFRQDTLESVNEAIQLYILAAEILGPRPQSITSSALGVKTLSYAQMKELNIDDFGNVAVLLENSLVKPIDNAKGTVQNAAAQSTKQTLGLAPQMFFFTVPRNERMTAYWNLLDDRLFKIRNGMNIDGVRRQLSLFAPPIDPAMLVRATAAGISLGDALNDINAPLPKYRFTFMVQKAVELCNVVQSMGGAMLSAVEKKDAEETARLRAEHETALLRLATDIKQMQIEEATAAVDGLEITKKAVTLRLEHYRELINSCDSDDPRMSKLEKSQIDKMRDAANLAKEAQVIRTGLKITAALPDFIAGISGFGGSPVASTTMSPRESAGVLIGITADVKDIKAVENQNIASRTGIEASYERRLKEWEFQATAAENELVGIEKQIVGAEIRRQVAQRELNNLKKQIEQSEVIYTFFKNKYTNKELYHWMLSQLSSLYRECYKLAYDAAKRAEKSYKFELGVDADPPFVRFGNWDGRRDGLLAGEKLMFDLRRMEMAYIENNGRELEITRPVSVAQMKNVFYDRDPIRDLIDTGRCEFEIPEELFDLDFPGHYFRRIRSVRLTMPCLAGPHTGASAKLTLLTNRMRKSKHADNANYAENPIMNDPRFVYGRVGIQSIAASQPDGATGVFDFNFRDERYLPFEGAGAVSTWRLELFDGPKSMRQFDYGTISDIVLHISYTAREDGGLAEAVKKWFELKNKTGGSNG